MLTEDEEAFLTELYQSLDQREVGPDDPRYVDLHRFAGAVNIDVVDELVRAVTRSGPGSSVYFSGLRGSGKSTQLLRAKAALEAQGFAVVRLDAESYLNVRSPLDPSVLLFALAGGIEEQALATGLLPDGPPRWLSRAKEWVKGLPGRVEVEPGVSVGFPEAFGATASLSLSLQTDESFVASMRAFFADRLSLLVTEANGFVVDVERRMRAHREATGGTWKGLVVLFDSLDHAKGKVGDADDFRAIRDALESLFTTQVQTTTLECARTLYCLPPYVRGLSGVVRSLASVKVTDRNGSAVAPGREAMRAVIETRVPGGDIPRLIRDDDLDGLIGWSGGNYRELMRLLQDASIITDALPLTGDAVAGAVANLRGEIRRNLALDERALLKHVHETHDADLETGDDWVRLSPLYDRYLIMAYRNGEVWYDVHPLVVDLLE